MTSKVGDQSFQGPKVTASKAEVTGFGKNISLIVTLLKIMGQIG